MARISRNLILPQAPKGWQSEIEKIIARFAARQGSADTGETMRRILRHEETETALRVLLSEAKKRKVKFDLGILYKSIHRCAVLSFPYTPELRENSRRTKKLIDALRTVQKDVGLISRFVGAEDEQFERMLNKILESTVEYTRKYRGAPRQSEKYFCAAALRKHFVDTFGVPVLPAIDALLTATFGPHDDISRIMKKARHIFD